MKSFAFFCIIFCIGFIFFALRTTSLAWLPFALIVSLVVLYNLGSQYAIIAALTLGTMTDWHLFFVGPYLITTIFVVMLFSLTLLRQQRLLHGATIVVVTVLASLLYFLLSFLLSSLFLEWKLYFDVSVIIHLFFYTFYTIVFVLLLHMIFYNLRQSRRI